MPSLQTSGGVNAHANVLRSDEMRYATAVPQYTLWARFHETVNTRSREITTD